jgi:hypothetical protein
MLPLDRAASPRADDTPRELPGPGHIPKVLTPLSWGPVCAHSCQNQVATGEYIDKRNRELHVNRNSTHQTAVASFHGPRVADATVLLGSRSDAHLIPLSKNTSLTSGHYYL